MQRNCKDGFTLIELLTVMAIISLLVGLLLPALVDSRRTAQLLRDQTQVKEIHQAWTSFSISNQGSFPTPGLVNPLGTIIGRGDEDPEANTSDNMYSVSIMLDLFDPQILIGPTELSGYVMVKDDYDRNLYDPVGDVYWDDSFEVDLDQVANASYAHMPICGERKRNHWINTMDSRFAVISNRGVVDGSTQASDYYESVTIQLHGGRRQWVGNVCYNDNHVEVEDSFYPDGISFIEPVAGGAQSAPDNIFRNETGTPTSGDGSDVWLTLVSDISADCTLTAEWD